MYFDLVSRLLGLPFGLLSSLCFVESNHTNAYVPMDGKSASYGICQVKERTARGVDPAVSRADLMNVEKNIWIAGLHLRHLLRKNKSIDKSLCQYNTGKPYKNCVYARKVTAAWLKSLAPPKNNSSTNSVLSLRKSSDVYHSIGRSARKQKTRPAKTAVCTNVPCVRTSFAMESSS